MRSATLLLTILINTCIIVTSAAQNIPFVNSVENSGADCPLPPLPPFSELPHTDSLPDPFMWSGGNRGRVASPDEWRCRRAEIGIQIQQYLIGKKPDPPDSLNAGFADSTFTVTIAIDNKTLTLTSEIRLPDGEGPFPAVIGVGFPGGTGSLPPDIFTSRGIATIRYNFAELAPWGFEVQRGTGGFYELYPDPKIGFFTAWAWGVSRIIDGLEKAPELDIDLSKLAITGCSFAGKIALYSSAFDERIALTIAQEPGGGGVASWRVTETLDGSRETLRNAQGAPWYHEDASQFNEAVTKLPFDHHELAAMIAPRGLLVLGNPDYEWLAEESAHVSLNAARQVWNALGAPDRFGYSIVAGHPHCQLPSSQRPEVEAFVEKFLLGNTLANTDVLISPFTIDMAPWITWEIPDLWMNAPEQER